MVTRIYNFLLLGSVNAFVLPCVTSSTAAQKTLDICNGAYHIDIIVHANSLLFALALYELIVT